MYIINILGEVEKYTNRYIIRKYKKIFIKNDEIYYY